MLRKFFFRLQLHIELQSTFPWPPQQTAVNGLSLYLLWQSYVVLNCPLVVADFRRLRLIAYTGTVVAVSV